VPPVAAIADALTSLLACYQRYLRLCVHAGPGMVMASLGVLESAVRAAPSRALPEAGVSAAGTLIVAGIAACRQLPAMPARRRRAVLGHAAGARTALTGGDAEEARPPPSGRMHTVSCPQRTARETKTPGRGHAPNDDGRVCPRFVDLSDSEPAGPLLCLREYRSHCWSNGAQGVSLCRKDD
jgi:hypothetical protein